MKAVIWTAYGSPDVLDVQEIHRPTPEDNEVLIKVHSATVTAGDCEVRSLSFPFYLSLPMRAYMGWQKPTRVQILGMEIAGKIEAVGDKVTRFKVGDAIFGSTGFNFGAYAEYAVLPENAIITTKPKTMSYEEAACIPTGGLEALHFLNKANIHKGQQVLINGAGGSIGTAGIQLAKLYGATVTAVDSLAKLPMLTDLGADEVIDYHTHNFWENGTTYDVIFDVIGKTQLSKTLKALKPDGVYLVANPRLHSMIQSKLFNVLGKKRIIMQGTDQTVEDLEHLKTLVEAGSFKTVIDRRFTLNKIADAHYYVETGDKQGNVVITVA